jgi:hypothetical protein
MNLNQQIEVGPCAYDYESNNCNSKICFSITSQPIALSGVNCYQPYNENITCSTCSLCNGQYCRQKIILQQNNQVPNGPIIDCVYSCPTPGNSNFIVNLCASGQDTFGQISNCCMSFLTTGSQVCSTSLAPLSSTNFIKWADSYHFMAILMNMLFLCLALQLF